MKSEFSDRFLRLKNYCEHEEFKGWDPYDGLNSKLFRATPLKHWSFARLAWIQLFKRNPFNLRKQVGVPKGYNPKALGLFLTAYSNLYALAEQGCTVFGTRKEIAGKIQAIGKKLIDLKTEGYSGTCWGYNFAWQARGGLYFKAYTPTVVATTFAAYGLLDAYLVLQKQQFLEEATSSARFVLDDLTRTPKKNGFLFSYAPEFGNNTVYNASLLGSKLLARIYSIEPNQEYLEASKASVTACCDAQKHDGSWNYGELAIQQWVDSFHTGFNLEALYDYQKFTGDTEYKHHIHSGFEYYLNNFFTSEGIPKYYDNQTYPVDIHSPAEFIMVMARTNRLKNHQKLVDRVLGWTCQNMQDEEGFFYYQINKTYKNKIPYMRWSQAWMLAALSYYVKYLYTDA